MNIEFMEMDRVKLQIPFTVLSTRINVGGDTENRVLTPFGSIDMTFRKSPNIKDGGPHFEISVNGDADHWVSDNGSIAEFQSTLLHFIWEIVQKHMYWDSSYGFFKLCVNINGFNIEQIMRCRHGLPMEHQATCFR